jgi:prephenate dehydrogenase (NADP+)
MMNPSARQQIRQYARSATHLYKLMVTEQKTEFEARIRAAGAFVFANRTEPFLLSDDLLDQFSLSIIPKDKRTPNSHLSLLAMADCWHTLGINPYDHMICQTPIFR